MRQLARRAGVRPPVVIITLGAVVGVVALIAVAGILGRIDGAAMGVCTRLAANDLATNRANAIIYTQMVAIAQNVRERGRPNTAAEYERIAALPSYQPPTDCRRAVHDPGHYRPGAPIPFADVPDDTLARLLAPPGRRRAP